LRSLSSPTLSTLCPYTTLFRSLLHATTAAALTVSLFPFFFPINIKHKDLETVVALKDTAYPWFDFFVFYGPIFTIGSIFVALCIDRKSTRLNSSHVSSSYAVFC